MSAQSRFVRTRAGERSRSPARLGRLSPARSGRSRGSRPQGRSTKGPAPRRQLGERARGSTPPELLARIRDIRSSEKVFYRKVLDIYALSVDYDPKAETSQTFFQTVQNKMHWAAHGHTAAEVTHTLILNRSLVQVSPPLIDYVVAHELAHVGYGDHGPAFIAHLTEKMPDWRTRKKALENLGPELFDAPVLR
ncbi:RhuM family protein [Qipengyuania sp. GPGPB31]|uniref:RhuM family protein n=1 Tax=Qipengyuania sp. GPGPB31 TaxID=3023518 RepID=UPI003134406A